MDLDVNLLQGLRAHVDINQSRIDGLVKLAKARDETDRSWEELLIKTDERSVNRVLTLLNTLVWIGTENATRDSATETDDATKALHHSTVESMCNLRVPISTSSAIFGLNLLLHFQFLDPAHTLAIVIMSTTLLLAETRVAHLHLTPLQRLNCDEAVLALLSVSRTDRLLCYFASLVMNTVRTCGLTMSRIMVNDVSSIVRNRKSWSLGVGHGCESVLEAEGYRNWSLATFYGFELRYKLDQIRSHTGYVSIPTLLLKLHCHYTSCWLSRIIQVV